jgi:hypothetical protein
MSNMFAALQKLREALMAVEMSEDDRDTVFVPFIELTEEIAGAIEEKAHVLRETSRACTWPGCGEFPLSAVHDRSRTGPPNYHPYTRAPYASYPTEHGNVVAPAGLRSGDRCRSCGGILTDVPHNGDPKAHLPLKSTHRTKRPPDRSPGAVSRETVRSVRSTCRKEP